MNSPKNDRSAPGAGSPTAGAGPRRAGTAHRQHIQTQARLWLGTPYHHRASLRGVGTDCLGLIRGLWREIYGAEPEPLPDYTRDWAEATGRETLLEAATRHMPPTATPRPGDVLLFRLRPRTSARHIGLLAERDNTLTLIHALSPHHVTESPLTERWQRRVAGAFVFPG